MCCLDGKRYSIRSDAFYRRKCKERKPTGWRIPSWLGHASRQAIFVEPLCKAATTKIIHAGDGLVARRGLRRTAWLTEAVNWRFTTGASTLTLAADIPGYEEKFLGWSEVSDIFDELHRKIRATIDH